MTCTCSIHDGGAWSLHAHGELPPQQAACVSTRRHAERCAAREVRELAEHAQGKPLACLQQTAPWVTAGAADPWLKGGFGLYARTCFLTCSISCGGHLLLDLTLAVL